MYPQNPWMMNVKAEEMQRDVERQMQLKQARSSANRSSHGLIGGARRAIGLAMIAIGGKIQPGPRKVREYDAGIELELAR